MSEKTETQTKETGAADAAADKKARNREKEKKRQLRKERRAMRRYRFVFWFFGLVMRPFMRWKLNYSCDDISGVEGPYLLLANHNMELDPVLVGLATRRQLFFVASEHVMRKGLKTRLLMRYFNPIIHQKGKAGTKSVMAILKHLKKGNNVCLFAEGNRSFNGLTGEISPATGKMARHSGAALVTYRFTGGFLTQPRFSTTLRKGKLVGHLVHVYKPDELRAMTEDEVNEAIRRDLFEDAYEAQTKERVAYRGKKLAYGLESTLFWCPACGRFQTLRSTEKELICDACGDTSVYNEYGETERSDGTVLTLTEWDKAQRDALIARAGEASEEEILFEDSVQIREVDAEHRFGECRTERCVAYRNRIVIGDRTLTDEDIDGMAVYSRNFIVAHIGNPMVQYDVRGDERFCALKYRYLLDTWKTTEINDGSL